MTDKRIERQINIWNSRVFFPNEKFKENSKADLNKLKQCIIKSRETNTFTIISSETEACIYKIGRFFVENGINNESITFQEGDIFEPYINNDSRYDWQAKQLCDELFSVIERKIKSKWLVVPDMTNMWSKKLSIYFITKLQQLGSYGLLFYADKNQPDNLAQILCEETYNDILQFPKSKYDSKKTTHVLEEDDY